MYAKVGLLALTLTLPVLAEEPEKPSQDCAMNHGRSGMALFVDLNQRNICMVHATGYYKGVVDVGDEIWFSLPEGARWEEMWVIYNQWIGNNPDKAHAPAYLCITRSLAEKYPMPKKEEE